VCVCNFVEDDHIMTLKNALNLYEGLSGRLPTEEEGLIRFVDGVEISADRPQKRLIQKLPLDRWGRAYEYRIPARRSRDRFDIFSLGADGIESDDDIGNW
jgi:general secretion pathway protein G